MTKMITQRVRETAFRLGEFTLDDLMEALPVYTFEEIWKLRGAIRWLRKSGEFTLVQHGLYRYQARRERLTKVAKMWRAMRIKEYFTKRDIVKLSGASKSHVKKYFIILKRKNYIARVEGKGSKEGVYRLMDPDNAPLEHPKSPV